MFHDIPKLSSSHLGFESREYRLNVAALVRVPFADGYRYLMCKRSDHDAWQCPQGGLERSDPSPTAGLLRELREELGVCASQVKIVFESPCWRRYRFGSPRKDRESDALLQGQQQKWFLCELDSLERCDLSQSLGEFSDVQAFEAERLASLYAAWKAGPFIDFCREIRLPGMPLVALGAPSTGVPSRSVPRGSGDHS